MRLVAATMIENLQSHRFQRDIEKIIAVGPAYVALVLETIGLELDRVDDVRRIVQEHAEIIPGPGADPQRPSPPGAA